MLYLLHTKQLLLLITFILLIWMLFRSKTRMIISWYRTVRLALHLKGPPALPLLGNIFFFNGNLGPFYIGQRILQNYGPIMRGWFAVLPIISVEEPKNIHVILNNSKVSSKNFFYSFMHNFLGEGLVTSNGQKWKSHRRSISLYFKTNYLEQFIQTFDDRANLMVKELQGKNEVKITTFVNRCILNILHLTIMGISQEEKNIINESPFNKFTTNGKSEFEQKSNLREFARKILEKRRRDKDEKKILNWCLLDGFIEISETKPDFTDEDIVDELCTFMLAGQDTVGAATAFTLYHLAKHGDVQKRVVKEIKENIPISGITLKVLDEMKYLDQCIYESLRICPSVPMISRRLCEDIKLGEYVLPEGCNVFISPFTTHRMPQYFPNPETFNPERFTRRLDNYAYIAFGSGPRDCLGKKFALLEIKTIISRVLQNYELSLILGKEELQLQYRITLRSKGGIMLKLKNRQ